MGQHQLPAAAAQRVQARAVVVVEDLARGRRRWIAQQRLHVHAVDPPRGRAGAAQGRHRGEHVHGGDQPVALRAGGCEAGQARDERNASAALEDAHLALAQLAGAAGVVPVALPRTVVAREDDEGVVGESVLLERRHDPARGRVDLADHVAVGPLLAHARHAQGRAERDVGHRVGEVEEERLLAAPLDEVEGAEGVALRQLRLLRQRRDGLAEAVPVEHLQLGVAASRYPEVVEGPHVVGVGQPVDLVEALLGGQERRAVAEVPLADHAGRVALLLQELGQGLLLRVEPVASGGAQRAEDADPLRVAPRQERGSRRAADRLGHVEVREAHALGGEPVQVRRLEALRAVAPDVGVALVIGEDEHDVGRALLLGAGRRRGAEGEHEGDEDEMAHPATLNEGLSERVRAPDGVTRPSAPFRIPRGSRSRRPTGG